MLDKANANNKTRLTNTVELRFNFILQKQCYINNFAKLIAILNNYFHHWSEPKTSATLLDTVLLLNLHIKKTCLQPFKVNSDSCMAVNMPLHS